MTAPRNTVLTDDVLCSENRVIVFAVVLSHYTRVSDRQTTDIQTTAYDYSGTVQCNCYVRLKIEAVW